MKRKVIKQVLIKCISWRITAILTSIIIGTICGLSTNQNLLMALLLNIVNMIIYYFHEIIWNKIQKGEYL